MTNQLAGRTEGEDRPPGLQAGLVIAAASVLSVVFMAFHPRIESRAPAEVVEEIGRKALVNGVVHGCLIALIGALVYGLSCFASRLGMARPAVRAGLVGYVMGAVAMCAAALVSGLIVPELVSLFQGRPNEELARMQVGMALCRAVNQVCSRTGVLAMAVAIVLWSAELLRRPGAPRVVGALGCAAGALPALALLSGNLPMGVHGVGAFVVCQTAWCVAVAVLLIRGRL